MRIRERRFGRQVKRLGQRQHGRTTGNKQENGGVKETQRHVQMYKDISKPEQSVIDQNKAMWPFSRSKQNDIISDHQKSSTAYRLHSKNDAAITISLFMFFYDSTSTVETFWRYNAIP
jgi:F0F1-type ATP synthase alpha subunit